MFRENIIKERFQESEWYSKWMVCKWSSWVRPGAGDFISIRKTRVLRLCEPCGDTRARCARHVSRVSTGYHEGSVTDGRNLCRNIFGFYPGIKTPALNRMMMIGNEWRGRRGTARGQSRSDKRDRGYWWCLGSAACDWGTWGSGDPRLLCQYRLERNTVCSRLSGVSCSQLPHSINYTQSTLHQTSGAQNTCLFVAEVESGVLLTRGRD